MRRYGRGRSTPSALWLLFVILAGTSCASAGTRFVRPFELPDHEWAPVYADESFVVSLDVAHVSPGPEDDSLAVWYETRHLEMREHEGSPWNREVIHSLLRCDPLSFKTVRTTIFLEHGPPIAQIGGLMAEVLGRPWRPAGPGSVDEGAMRGACEVVQADRGFSRVNHRGHVAVPL